MTRLVSWINPEVQGLGIIIVLMSLQQVRDIWTYSIKEVHNTLCSWTAQRDHFPESIIVVDQGRQMGREFNDISLSKMSIECEGEEG